MRAVTEAMPMWARIYLQRFKRPVGFDPVAVELVLTQELVQWRENVLIEVMQWMQNNGQDWVDYPTAHKLAVAYKAYRKWQVAPRAEITSARDVTQRESLVGECKAKILKIYRDSVDGEIVPVWAWQDIWDQICRPDDAGDFCGSQALEEWAERTIGFRRAYTGLAEKTRQAVAGAVRAMRQRSAA